MGSLGSIERRPEQNAAVDAATFGGPTPVWPQRVGRGHLTGRLVGFDVELPP
jgi:hypothetical protein